MKSIARTSSFIVGFAACAGLAAAQTLDSQAQGIPFKSWPPQPSTGPLRVELSEAPTPEEAAASADAAEVAAAAMAGVSSAGEAGKAGALAAPMSREIMDFSFRDADVGSVMRGFALKFGKNIILASNVGGKVNLQLKRVPFNEGFDLLLNQMGLVAVQKGSNVIQIVKAVDLPALVQVFQLKYRFAPDLEKTINATLTKRERENALVVMDPASNSLIVTAASEFVEKVKRIIEQLDIESPQISIKARLIEIGAGNAINYGITWANTSTFNKPGAQGATRAVLDQGNYTISPLTGKEDASQTITRFPTGGILDISAVLDGKSYYALINAIKADTRSKTISEPMILTGNNKSSKIHVGQNLPVKTSLVSQTATVQSIQYIPEGIDLEVTPVVSPGSNMISLKVRVMVAEFLGFQNDAPVTTERVATTEVAIESGKTVVIGGLIKDKSGSTDTGIPFLKDIPILGWLFKSHRKTKYKTELLIFITPEVLVRSTMQLEKPTQ